MIGDSEADVCIGARAGLPGGETLIDMHVSPHVDLRRNLHAKSYGFQRFLRKRRQNVTGIRQCVANAAASNVNGHAVTGIPCDACGNAAEANTM